MAAIATDAPGRVGRLTWRLVLTVSAVVASVLVVALIGLGIVAERTATRTSAAALERTTRLLTVMLQEREGGLARAAQVFAQNPDFRAILLSGRVADLYDQSIEAAERTGASWVQVTDSVGMRLARSDEPAASAAALGGSALIAGALGGEVTGGMGVSGDTVLFQAVAVPIIGATQIAGTLMATQVIDSALAAAVRAATASEVVFFVIDTAGAVRVVASSFGRSHAVEAALQRDAAERVHARGEPVVPVALEYDGEHFVGRVVPLRSAGGEVLGGVAALRSLRVEGAPFASLRWALVIAGILGLAVAFGLALLTARSLARPILALTQATRRVAQGDYGVEVDVQGRDEIGTLADSIRVMIADLREKDALVALLAGSRSSGATRPGSAELDVAAASADDASVVIEPGATVGHRYEIRNELGAGGAGVVYRAYDRELGEVVALKTLREDSLHDDPMALERLKGELRLARRLTHRNIVRTYDLGVAGGRYWITMELVTGTSLRALLDRSGALPLAATLSIGKQLLRALQVAHEADVLHRDIKPQNLMVQPDGTLKVMDFGIARAVSRTAALTQVGMVVGTPEYMAPEQLLGEGVDARSDLFAAGVVLFECLSGRRPVEASAPAVLIARVLREPMPRIASVVPTVPPALAAVVDSLLQREASARPSSAAEVYEMLQHVDARG